MTDSTDSLQQWRELVHQFECGTLRKVAWTHRAHLVVGLWYVLHDESENKPDAPEKSLNKLRDRIRAYNEATGGVNSDSAGYHETLTRLYWLGIRDFLRQYRRQCLPCELDELGSLQQLLQSPLADKAWPLQYYSRELLMSVRARANG